MSVLAVLVFTLVPQDESRLKEAWPKLAEAWKTVEASAPDSTEDGDAIIKTAAKLHDAFESAGLFAPDGDYVSQAFKTFIRRRAAAGMGAGLAPGQARAAMYLHTYGDPMTAFLHAVGRLKSMERDRLDDEDNFQDEMSTARKALQDIGITADSTPAPLRRRVLALARALAGGDAYPEPARATEEQAAQIRAWIGALGHEQIEEREKASRELRRMGEVVIPFLQAAKGSSDAEVAGRVNQLLGVGHAPWTEAAAAVGRDLKALHFEANMLRKLMEDAKKK